MSNVTGKEWLQHFEGWHKAQTGKLFYQAVRDGADSPRAVCSKVFLALGRRLKEDELTDWQRELFPTVRHWMNEDRAGAMVLAQYCLDFEAATPEARARMVEKKR